MELDLKLSGKLVLVTGSTSGIGKGAAKSFLQEGARVIINGRTEAGVNAVVEELSSMGTVYGITADVSKAEDCEYLVKKVNKIGNLDVLVNNTGIF